MESLLVRDAPVGVISVSSSMVSCWPRRELLREYGREGPGVLGFCSPGALGGAGLANLGGAPIALLEKPDGVRPPFRAGVAVKFGCGLRKGDSGRGNDGRPCGLNCGLGARAPGPTDCENFGSDGVSGLKCGFVVVERLKLLRYDDGVVGVGGKSSEVVDERFCARCTGRKMPEPGTEVLKYCLLPRCQYARETGGNLQVLTHPLLHRSFHAMHTLCSTQRLRTRLSYWRLRQ